ncbi:MAG: hypothetical protein H7A35_05315 [Planctomycetales bacterium]|nr:hypothetical protein [bacterium]UNM09476.1 MAG: hypothetical protein H7A35_05315 [Planctomycetales bacterium]
MNRTIPYWLPTLLAVSLCACGARTLPLETVLLPAPGQLDASGPAAPLRHAGSLYNQYKDGASVVEKSANASIYLITFDVDLIPDSQNNSWTIWQLTEDGSTVDSFSINYTENTDIDLYLGIADFQTGRWQFQPAPASMEEVQVTPAQRSAKGSTYICLLAEGNGYLSIQGVSTMLDNGWDSAETGIELPSYIVQSPLGAIEVAGHPAVAFFDANGLSYLRAATADGMQPGDWGTPVLVDATASGQWIDMRIINGNPAIAYHDDNSAELRYVRCGSPEGALTTDWPSPVKIDNAPLDHVPECSLAQVDGTPALAYLSPDLNLTYRHSSSPDGNLAADWQAALVIHSGGGVSALNPSLQVIRGKPAVSFYDKQNGRQLFMAADTASGDKLSAWPAQPAVVTEGDLLEHSWADLLSLNSKPTMYLMHADSASNTDPNLRFRQIQGGNGNEDQDWSLTTSLFYSLSPGSGLLSGIGLGDYIAIAYSRDATDSLDVRVQRELPNSPFIYGYPEYPLPGSPSVLACDMLAVDDCPAFFYVTGDGKLRYARDFSFKQAKQ